MVSVAAAHAARTLTINSLTPALPRSPPPPSYPITTREAVTSSTTGLIYYRNKETGVRQWKHPAAAVVKPETGAAAAGEAAADAAGAARELAGAVVAAGEAAADAATATGEATAGGDAEPALPAGWEVFSSTKFPGAVFYRHSETREKRWTHPGTDAGSGTDAAPAAAPIAPATAEPPPAGWELSAHPAGGGSFFRHIASGAVQWSRPTESETCVLDATVPPAGWEVLVSATHADKIYWRHVKTRAVSWTRPTEAETRALDALAAGEGGDGQPALTGLASTVNCSVSDAQ